MSDVKIEVDGRVYVLDFSTVRTFTVPAGPGFVTSEGFTGASVTVTYDSGYRYRPEPSDWMEGRGGTSDE